jgi:hypothetical protein
MAVCLINRHRGLAVLGRSYRSVLDDNTAASTPCDRSDKTRPTGQQLDASVIT